MDASFIERLARPESFSHPVTEIRVIETHISWVMLTGTYAYKIKKPVDFGFLDFSSLARRKSCCEEEVRLNGRTSKDLYLAVVPVTEQDGVLKMAGEGDAVEYAVKMRQFDPGATMDNLLATNGYDPDSFERLGHDMAEFHLSAARTEASAGWGSFRSIADPVEENFRQILALVPPEDEPLVLQLKAAARHSLEELRPVFQQRKEAGFVRELHGDLHAGNLVWLDGTWVAFDCIEFNPELRWIDTMSDAGFLVMDLAFRGHREMANRFLNALLEHSGDHAGLAVLPFYQSYRAMVRAKIAILRLQQMKDEQQRQDMLGTFRAYLQFCVGLSRKSRPFMIMMMGVSGSGKSTVAKQVAARHDAIHVRSDVVRKRLFGLKPSEASELSLRNRLYSSAASADTFAEMLKMAETLLSLSLPVIVDATFIQQRSRTPFLTLARERGIPFVILHCTASPAVLAERIALRAQAGRDPSEADASIMLNQLKNVERPTESERPHVINVGVEGWQMLLENRIGQGSLPG